MTLKLNYNRGSRHNTIDVTDNDNLMLGVIKFQPFFGIQFQKQMTGELNKEDVAEINFVCGKLQQVMQ